MITIAISKEQFEEAYRKFPPSRIEKFYMKYISIHSLHGNRLVAIVVSLLSIVPLLIGIIFKLLHISEIGLIIPNFIYMFIIASLGIFWLVVWNRMKKRYDKIRKYVGMSKVEYEILVKSYYYHNYPSIKDFITSFYLKDNKNK